MCFIPNKIIEIVRSVAKQEEIHPVKLEEFLHGAQLDVSVVRVHSLVRGLALGHVVERQLSGHSNSLQYFHAVLSQGINPGEVIVIYMSYDRASLKKGGFLFSAHFRGLSQIES